MHASSPIAALLDAGDGVDGFASTSRRCWDARPRTSTFRAAAPAHEIAPSRSASRSKSSPRRGTQVIIRSGHFPSGWAEWNGAYRDAVRGSSRGSGNAKLRRLGQTALTTQSRFADQGGPQKSQLHHRARRLHAWDLVSYNERNNGLPGVRAVRRGADTQPVVGLRRQSRAQASGCATSSPCSFSHAASDAPQR